MSHPFILDSSGELPYLLALPDTVHSDTPLVVSVHGVTRRPLEHAMAFAGPTLAAGAALLVPLFSEHRHRRYPQLAHPRSGRRSDLALIETVTSVCRRHGLPEAPLHLFGYSAGAQFVHRFALWHPQRVAALAVGAAGWYTWPDRSLPWPLGWGGIERWLGHEPDTQAFLRLRIRVWVGERDTQPDESFRSEPELDALQGTSRLERAHRWVQALRSTGARDNVGVSPSVHTVAESGHDFAQCARRGNLAQRVIDFLLPGLQSPRVTRKHDRHHAFMTL